MGCSQQWFSKKFHININRCIISCHLPFRWQWFFKSV
jgi:hypothetical protein